ncbi:TPA: hypothetical protein ACH3X1_008154 [Trebouxia sp. C0004]
MQIIIVQHKVRSSIINKSIRTKTDKQQHISECSHHGCKRAKCLGGSSSSVNVCRQQQRTTQGQSNVHTNFVSNHTHSSNGAEAPMPATKDAQTAAKVPKQKQQVNVAVDNCMVNSYCSCSDATL